MTAALMFYRPLPWLARIAGERDRFHILPDNLVYRILSSTRNQTDLTQPAIQALGRVGTCSSY